MVEVAPGARECGGGGLNAVVIAEVALTLIGSVLALFVGSVTEVAVITTVLAGTVAGAV
jgi:hypothetical protein